MDTAAVIEDLTYPHPDAATSILKKIGVDPNTRDLSCQDFEYTTCRTQELEQYLEVYGRADTTIHEKRLLGCYFMEGLNDFVSIYQTKHPLQNQIFEVLHNDMEIHTREFNYRVETDEPLEEHWWAIRTYVLAWRLENNFGL